jgi:5-methylcytosine-specific restriction endonuclease McrA
VVGVSYEYIPKPGVRIRDQKALDAAKRDRCEICGHFCQSTGHVHHHKTKGSGGDDIASNLIFLCFDCHEKVHRARVGYQKADMDAFIRRRNALRLPREVPPPPDGWPRVEEPTDGFP